MKDFGSGFHQKSQVSSLSINDKGLYGFKFVSYDIMVRHKSGGGKEETCAFFQNFLQKKRKIIFSQKTF